MVAVVRGRRNGLVGTGWANSCLGCTNVVRKCYSHLVGASFLAVKAFRLRTGVCWPRMLTIASWLMSGHG